MFYFYFLDIVEKKLLYAYMENTHSAVLNTLSVYISVNNNTNLKKIWSFLSRLYGMD